MPKSHKQRNQSSPAPRGGSRRKQRPATADGGNRNGDVPALRSADVVTRSCVIPRVPKNYHFIQMDTTLQSFAGSAGGGNGLALSISLSANISQAGTFTALFDQYRFVAVTYRILPRQSMVTAATIQPPLFTVIDYDDSTTPTSRGQMVDYDSCSETQVYESILRIFAPHVAMAAYSGAFTSFANRSMQWIDSGSPSVAHYGLKLWIDTCSASVPVWDIEAQYVLEFRNVR